jgi:GNAT superfamily N-acetyltransferase
MHLREATVADAEAMSDVLEELVAAGMRNNTGDANYVRSHYLEHPHRLQCLLAIDAQNKLLGFQSLKFAHEANPYATPVGWGIIGTHVRPSAARTGVGSRLFAGTLAAAHSAELPAIEAYIGAENSAAIAYYDAMGFRTYRRTQGIICKMFPMNLDDRSRTDQPLFTP